MVGRGPSQGPGPSRLRTWLAWAAQRNSGSCPSMWTAGWTAVLATFPEHAPRKTWNVSWMTQSSSKVMHSCGRAVRRGRGCLQGRGLCFGTISPVCRHGSLGCAHSQGCLLDALPGGCAMGIQLCSCPRRQSADTSPVHSADALLLLFPALGTQLVPISAPHGHGLAWPTRVLTLSRQPLHTPPFPLLLCPAQTPAGMCPALYLKWACLQPTLDIRSFKSTSLGSATVGVQLG